MTKFAPSPASVLAIIALTVALSGTAVAAQVALAPVNSVGGGQIIDGSIRLADIAPSTVRMLHGQKGQMGPQGPMGPPGPAGAAGAIGGFNPAKVSYQYASQSTVLAGSLGQSTALSPSGAVPIGGGGLSGIGKIGVSKAVSNPNGWAIMVYNDSNITITISAFAVCAAL